MSDWDEVEAKSEDLIEYAEAVLSDGNHRDRDDFSCASRELIRGLLLWIERLESRLSVSCQRNAMTIASLREELRKTRSDVHAAMEYANGRWCEWGERAETVRDRLEVAIGEGRNEVVSH